MWGIHRDRSYIASPPRRVEPRRQPDSGRLVEYRALRAVIPQSTRLESPSFTRLADSVNRERIALHTWADELPKLRRRIDELWADAKQAQMAGNEGRAQRRLESIKVLKKIDEVCRLYGMNGSPRAAKALLR